MSRTAITSKFKTRWLENEGRYWVGKLSIDIDPSPNYYLLLPLMPDEDKTFSGSLVLDLRIFWRHMHTLYWMKIWHVNNSSVKINSLFPSHVWKLSSFFLHWKAVFTHSWIDELTTMQTKTPCGFDAAHLPNVFSSDWETVCKKLFLGCTWRHHCVKSETKEPPKLLSSSDMRGSKVLSEDNF